jgi:hypothetical protein
MDDRSLRTLGVGAKEDCGAEDPLKGCHQAPILGTSLLQTERIEHLGGASEGDPLPLLANREGSEEDRYQSILSPREAVAGMPCHLEKKVSVSPFMEKIPGPWSFDRKATQDERSRSREPAENWRAGGGPSRSRRSDAFGASRRGDPGKSPIASRQQAGG